MAEATQQPSQQKDYRHFVRVANTDLDGSKPMLQAVQKIKGVSVMYAHALCTCANIDELKRAGTLSQQEVDRLERVLKTPLQSGIPVWMLNRRLDYESGENMHLTGADLDYTKDNDVKRMKKIKSYKGLRHQWGLTVRGQRTKSNFRKNKGKVKGIGGKKKTTERK